MDALAALEGRLKAALGGGERETLLAAEAAFAARFKLAVLRERTGPVSETELLLCCRLRQLPTIRRLLWALERIDRYANLGRGRAGAGLEILERLMDQALEDFGLPAMPAVPADVARGRRLIGEHGGLLRALFATHPDRGGSRGDFEAVKAAKDFADSDSSAESAGPTRPAGRPQPGEPSLPGPLGRRPRHLAYFIPGLVAEGRRFKHQHAPRIKAERAGRGARKARRYPPHTFYRRGTGAS